jgi:hypothetical protein
MKVHLTLNTVTAAIRQEFVGNNSYMVVPAVAATSPVMNGIYYPPEVWEWSQNSWNGRPVTINHPEHKGDYVLANDPQTLHESALGNLFAATYENNSLKGEMWLNEGSNAATNNADGIKIVTNFKAGKVLEVSTGLWVETVDEAGEIDGKEYVARAVNVWPDHLAILPNDIGACSVKDGCGAPRTNKEERKPMATRKTAFHLEGNEASFQEISKLLQSSVSGDGEYVWIMDVWPNKFVYEVETYDGEYQYYEREYELNDDQTEITTLSDRYKVEARRTYERVSNRAVASVQNLIQRVLNFRKGDKPMSYIDGLVKAGFDRKELELLGEQTVTLMHNRLLANEEEPAQAPEQPQAPQAVSLELPPELKEFADLIKAAGGAKAFADGLGDANSIAQTQRKNRDERIAYLATSSKNPFSAEELGLMNDEMLNKLEANGRTANYALYGANLETPASDDDEPAGMLMPSAGVRINKQGVQNGSNNA